MNKALKNIRILDLTHMLSGPYGAMILADLGAETIKVEPLQGEGTRKLLANDPKNSLDGMGAYYITLNRNKKSVALNLKSDKGLAVFYDLVREADVVISNFGVGVPERLGVDYETLKQINPRIITCTVTGFGSDGPKPKRPAFDQVAQATGGGMSITGTDPEHPVRSGIPIGDLGGGMFAVMGILTALVEREQSGAGQHVDISMLDCQVSMLNYMATMFFLSGENPYPIGNSHFVHVPYNTFHTSDGFIVIAVITDNFWQNLKDVVPCPEFDNPKYDGQPGRWEDRDMINRHLNEVLSENTSQYWLQRLEEKRIPCAPVNSFSQALNDAQVRHRNMVVELKHPNGKSTQGPGNPIKLSRNSEESFSAAPELGQDTDEVLRGLLGYDEARIADLKNQGSRRLMLERVANTVTINDVGPRDGLQNQEKILTPAERVQLVRALLDAGVDHVEVGAFVSPRAVPAMAGADQVLAGLAPAEGAVLTVLIPNVKGYQLATAAGAKSVCTVLYGSDGMARANVRMSRVEAEQANAEILQQARSDGVRVTSTIGVAFECPFDGPVDPVLVQDIAARFLELGTDELCIADTIGAANPQQVRALTSALVDTHGASRLSCHFHDTRAMGLANVFAALESGVRKFDASIGGLGGCPFAPGASGNVATEDVVMMLEQMGIDTGIDLNGLMRASELAQRLTGTAPGGRASAWLKRQFKNY